MEIIISIIGWIGFLSCSLSFLLLNLKHLKFDSFLYQGLNLFGGSGLIISSLYYVDYPNIASNALWVLISIYGITKYKGKN